MSMTMMDKKKHAFRRRVIHRGLTGNIMETEELMLRNVRVFCNMLQDENPVAIGGWHSAKDMTLLTAYVTSDIMGDVTFSRNWGMLKSEENRFLMELLPKGVLGINIVCIGPQKSSSFLNFTSLITMTLLLPGGLHPSFIETEIGPTPFPQARQGGL
jgi:hypothetical protein